MNKKRVAGAAVASALLFAPLTVQSTHALADSFYTSQTNAERADIANWVANSSQQIDQNMSSQNIDVNNLHGDKYVIQWGDTLSGISNATGISINKLAYDNNIQNIDLIYAGDVLILNRDGEVPSDYHYHGDGTYVAKTKVTINNFIDNSDNSVNINVSPLNIKVDSHDSYESPKDPVKDSDSDSSSSSESEDKASDSSSSKTNQVKNSKDDESSEDKSSSKKEIDDDEFSDAVKSEIEDKLDLDEDVLTIDFTGKDADSDDESDDVDTDDEDTDTDTDSDTETMYDDDQSIEMNTDKLTEKKAKKLADKIVKQLQDDDNVDAIKDADEVEMTITTEDDGFEFNVSLPSSDEDSDSESDADTDDEDVDTESEDTDDDVNTDDEDTDTDTEDDTDADSDTDSNNQVDSNSDDDVEFDD